MYPLREHVHTTNVQRDYATTFASLLSKLKKSNIDVEMEDKVRGTIVARCLALIVNRIFWRAWGDKLVFEVKEIDAATTQVSVYAIPNLFILKVGNNEKVIDWGDLKRLVAGLLD